MTSCLDLDHMSQMKENERGNSMDDHEYGADQLTDRMTDQLTDQLKSQ